MSAREIDTPDDGSAAWAEDQAAGLIGVAMYRFDKEGGAKASADFLASISRFALNMIHENPRFRAAYFTQFGNEESNDDRTADHS